MSVQTKIVTIKVTQNQIEDTLSTLDQSFANARILSVTTREDGKSLGQKTIVSEAKIKTITLNLKNENGEDVQTISLYRVLQLSRLGNGNGLQINGFINFQTSQILFQDAANMTTGEVVELCFEYEK